MTSQYRHRRTSNPSTVFPTLEPGEIATNTANRQLAVGDAASGTVGSPLALLALRYFDSRAIYAAGDLVYQNNIVYRAKAAAGPGAFNPSQWDTMAGTTDPQYVLKAGDTMTGALNLPAAAPTAGVHATNKTYVDNLVASKSTIYASINPPSGVPDNSIWMETDTGVAYFRYNDGSSTQWMILSPQIDVSLFVVRTGDTMTGPLVIPGPPTLAGHAANKAYVDTRSTVIASDTPPPTPIDNTIWLESDTGLLFIRYNDGSSAQWMSIPGIAGDAVRYDAAQNLNATQQAQARSNIGALKKNYVLNGGMQISQENGSTVGTVGGYYPVDQWLCTSGGTTGTWSIAQVAVPTPAGSPNRIRVTVTGADASVGTTDLVCVQHCVEGFRIADLRSGSTAAKMVTLQFGIKAPAGTYCVSFFNGGLTRFYVGEYTIAAGETNTDVVKSITLTLDGPAGAGLWAVNNTQGMYIQFALMAGSNYQVAAGAWSAGPSGYASSNQFNFMGIANNVFELFDVSLTEGNVAPAFQLPDYVSELALCQRYWEKSASAITGNRWNANVTSAQVYYSTTLFRTIKRVTPTMVLTNIEGISFPTASGTAVAEVDGFYESRTANATNIGRFTSTWTASARL